MARKLQKGDKVEWTSSGGKSTGKVVKKVTRRTTVKGHVAKPTKDQPQYVVKSDKSGKRAVHKPQGLKKRS